MGNISSILPKRMSKKISLFFVVVCVFLGMSCTKFQPQQPLYKGQVRVDSAKIRQINFNEDMAKQADVEIRHFVKNSTDRYTRLNCGAWLKDIEPDSLATPVTTEENIKVQMRISTLKRDPITRYEKTCRLDKNDLPIAVNEVLATMLRGVEMELVVPWYAGFGVSGNEKIEPYENIIIKVKIL